MFTFVYQLFDLYHLHILGLFLVFTVISWVTYFIKMIRARDYKNRSEYKAVPSGSVHVIIPVADEPIEIWSKVLHSVLDALKYVDYQITVVANGTNAVKEAELAQKLGIEVLRVAQASKREAIRVGTINDKGSAFTIILDSDTIVEKTSIRDLLRAFTFEDVGGATPNQEVFNREDSFFRRMSSWLEDIRFNEVVKGQSVTGSVSCLPGRMLAIRTSLLKQAVTALVKQTFLGSKCISGDDRFLTSWLLERNFRTIYVADSKVETDAPDTLGRFVKQRLRWSRTSLRETIRSLGWIFNHPFMAFTVLSTIVLRWLFFAVIINAVLVWTGVIHHTHYLQFSMVEIILYSFLGFCFTGFVRQLRHLINYPQDLPYLLPFLLVTTFVLTPVEWFGNLTIRESGWMTRRLK